MATVAELIAMAEIKAEEIYEADIWIQFINNTLDDLTPVAKMLKRVAVTGVSVSDKKAEVQIRGEGADPDLVKGHEFLNVYVTPTTPAGSMKQYRRLPMSDNVSSGWKTTLDHLLITNIPDVGGDPVTEAIITVDFYKKLDHVSEMDDVPDLPLQYHHLILLSMCSKSQQKEEELEDKNDFYAEYMRGKNDMALDRIWETEPQNRKFIRRARISSKIGGQG